MRAENLFGWYSSSGTAHLLLETVENEERLSMVYEHESIHQLLGTSTTFGYLQLIVDRHLRMPFAETTDNIRVISHLLGIHSVLTQEAAATFCSLVVASESHPDIVAHPEVLALDGLHKQAFDLFANVFAGSPLASAEQAALARSIASYALDTSILADWVLLRLQDANRLYAYLERPENSPDHRIQALIELLGAEPATISMELASYAEFADDATFAEGRLGSLEYSRLSYWRSPDFIKDLIDKSLHNPHHRRLPSVRTHAEMILEPKTRPYFISWPGQEAPLEWCVRADLVEVRRNTSDQPLGDAEYRLPARSAQAAFCRHDYWAPRQVVMHIGELQEFLDRVDPASLMTIVVQGFLSMIPANPSPTWTPNPLDKRGPPYDIDPKNAIHVLRDLRTWAGPRQVLLSSGGSIEVLALILGTIQAVGPIETVFLEGGARWGVVCYNIVGRESAVAVHPTLKTEWTRWESSVANWVDASKSSAQKFFENNPKMAKPISRYIRQFAGIVVSTNVWGNSWEPG